MAITFVINTTVKDGMTQEWEAFASKAVAAARAAGGATGYGFTLVPTERPRT